MTTVRLRHVQRYRDRHGKLRHYLRMPGRPSVPLPGLPGSPEFMLAYNAAVAAPPPARPVGERKATEGTLDALAALWYASPEFRSLRPQTQATYRRTVERLRARHGGGLVATLKPETVRRIRDAVADRPAAANHLLSVLRILLRFAIDRGWRDDDPARDVRRLRYGKTGFHTWTEAEIAAFEARWPTGSRPRLALALLLHTGQRRGDVVRMGRQHLRGGAIEVRQAKTGALLEIPLHPALAAELEQAPKDRLTFLATEAGQAFTPGGFYNRFAGWAEAAGLPKGCSPHGLRKAAARRLAEAGCTPHEIASITGHLTLSEVQRYTRAADQRRLASAAILRVRKGDGRGGGV